MLRGLRGCLLMNPSRLSETKEFHMASISKPQCPQCGSGLVHLEWHERANAQEVQDLWHCWNCKNEFVTVVTSNEKEPSVSEVTEPFFTSLLV